MSFPIPGQLAAGKVSTATSSRSCGCQCQPAVDLQRLRTGLCVLKFPYAPKWVGVVSAYQNNIKTPDASGIRASSDFLPDAICSAMQRTAEVYLTLPEAIAGNHQMLPVPLMNFAFHTRGN
jgi:hypothetical protein